MRIFTVLFGFLSPVMLAIAADAPRNIYAAGVAWNQSASPRIAGTGLYARAVNDSGTYAFTAVDVLPTTVKPLSVTTQISTGVAQRVFTIGGVAVYVPTSVGISYNGEATGWAWTTGALASVRVKGNSRVMPNVRVVKSSVSNNSGYQLILGALFGWGQ
ncbi:MAG: hypothetical protein ABFD89_29365 [Bryobacteraceae bacterium]